MAFCSSLTKAASAYNKYYDGRNIENHKYAIVTTCIVIGCILYYHVDPLPILQTWMHFILVVTYIIELSNLCI